MKNADLFDDVPDLDDVVEENDRPRAPSFREVALDIAQLVKRRDGRTLAAAVVQLIVTAYIEIAMRETIRTGSFRLPGGWGTLQLRRIAGSATPRRVPRGHRAEKASGVFPREPRVKVAYVAGVAMDDLLQRPLAPSVAAQRSPEPRDFLFEDRPVPTEADLIRNM